ncbi:hypothetical protein PLEOSDRAFT_167627 [Pleurotus ostreatus PC15]|uniref:Uncharacterized protein n=1 Tax=Pleurotus ostreatus (strain PC15) TaxID=1137138 RepID=A0A067P1V5_PLEO1|nr:hypothetical protein PLEOSDRAFT_167627 [Pleurotus ostreatus PC15]
MGPMVMSASTYPDIHFLSQITFKPRLDGDRKLQAGLRDARARILQGPLSATPAIDLPSDSTKSESNTVRIGSSLRPLLPLRLESDPKTCEPSAHGFTTTASLSVALNIDTYLWGTGKWAALRRHERETRLHCVRWTLGGVLMGVRHASVQLGPMGGVKVAMTVNANAEAKVTSTVQYGLQHLSTTIPPKKNTILTPYFNSTSIDGLFSGEASALVGTTGSITPMLMVGLTSSGGSARADAWPGVEVGMSSSAQATQAFGFDSGVASLTAVLLSHLYVKVKAGVEAHATWAWLLKWIGWTPGFCGTQTRRSLEETGVSNRSLAFSKRAAPTKPSSTTKSASCLPKGILGKAKYFCTAEYRWRRDISDNECFGYQYWAAETQQCRNSPLIHEA